MNEHGAVAHDSAPAGASRPGPAVADPAERAAIVGWLGGLFAAPPSAATIATLRGAGAAFVDALAEDPELGPGIRRFRAAVTVEVGDEVLAARLERLFGLLFLGIGGPDTVSPHESVHRSGRMFDAADAAMNRLLARHDLALAATGEPADHVAVEAALLARLIETGATDSADLAERMAAWIPDFAARLDARDPSGLWAGAADALAAAIRRERPLRPLETRD
jgi:TorA maturation chaperone TorD